MEAMAWTVTPRMALPYPDSEDTSLAPLTAKLEELATLLDAKGVFFGEGQISTRPAASSSTKGMFWISNCRTLSWCDGTYWWSMSGNHIDLRDFMDGQITGSPATTAAFLMYGSGGNPGNASTMLQAAIDRARAVSIPLILPAGTIGYQSGATGNTLKSTIDASGTKIVGPGQKFCTLNYDSAASLNDLILTSASGSFIGQPCDWAGFKIVNNGNPTTQNGVTILHSGRTGRFTDIGVQATVLNCAFLWWPGASNAVGTDAAVDADAINNEWLFDRVVVQGRLNLIGTASGAGVKPNVRFRQCSIATLATVTGGSTGQVTLEGCNVKTLELAQPGPVQAVNGSVLSNVAVVGSNTFLNATNSEIGAVAWGPSNGILDFTSCRFQDLAGNAPNLVFSAVAGKIISVVTRGCNGDRSPVDITTVGQRLESVAGGSLTNRVHASWMVTDPSTGFPLSVVSV
jgi:hypothetical protein